jgi:hypothetical protein
VNFLTFVSFMNCRDAAADIAVLHRELDWLGFVPAMDGRRFRACAGAAERVRSKHFPSLSTYAIRDLW